MYSLADLISKMLTVNIIILFSSVKFGITAKTLMLPLNANSHIMYFSQLGKALASEGDSVTIILPTSAKISLVSSDNFTVVRYKGTETQYSSSKEANHKLVKQAFSDSFLEKISLMYDNLGVHGKLAQSIFQDCLALANNSALMNEIQTHDFAILDLVFPQCHYAIAYKYNIPYASFGLPVISNILGSPDLPSQVPPFGKGISDHMPFMTRCLNVFHYMLKGVINNLLYGYSLVSKVAPEKPNITSKILLQNSKLAFYLDDPVLSFPTPQMPNMIFLADIMSRKANPLSGELEEIMCQSHSGVVLVSFGSMLEEMPSEAGEVFLHSMSQLEQTVIMKKVEFKKEVPRNVKLFKWIPQNDILGHKKTKLFISHCGVNSLIEAVTHKVPILGIPLYGDQPKNAFLVQHKGIGKQLKWGKFNSSVLTENIKEIINNPIYTTNINSLSEKFLDKAVSPGARASHMINHVVKFGDSHIKTKAIKLNMLQFYMIDIILFILFSLVLFIILVYICVRICFRAVCKTCSKPIKLKEQ